jgi:hypothetical protein
MKEFGHEGTKNTKEKHEEIRGFGVVTSLPFVATSFLRFRALLSLGHREGPGFSPGIPSGQ